MYKILLKQDLVPNIHLFKVAASAVAKKAQPGQFVVIRIDEKGERIPLTIARERVVSPSSLWKWEPQRIN